ncbi:hypothetical protein [Motilibacter aurantiacus]|uniref:hypothetical protein n=1 Tax=Motilibacter aurantiacus TaxID=2714955 RepID=UPI00140C76D5|nr:hypothetical protein [Motilibacter aurantiacus]NHC47199.1 hypothetical protein [Motilibacter aurantiacus]
MGPTGGGGAAERPVTLSAHPHGLLVSWAGEAATLEVGATVADGGSPVLVVGFRGPVSPSTAAASERVSGATGAASTCCCTARA